MKNRVIIYARASAECPATIDEQVEYLQAVADENGWSVARTFIDRPLPLRRGREQRPAEVALLSALRAGSVNKILLFSLDRIGKSLTELVGFLETCRAAGASIYIHDRRIDTATCDRLSLFDVSAMLADHLRQGRRDRIMRGQAAAKAANIRFGRPSIATAKTEKAKLMLANGKGVRETARLIAGISPASVSRIKASMSGAIA